MRTITYNVYEFDELPEDLKTLAINKQKEGNSEIWDWTYAEDVLSDWREALNAQGFIDPEIAYTGFWSQGDGASFTCKHIDLQVLGDYLGLWPVGKEKTYKSLLDNIDWNAYVSRHNHHYVHEHTINVRLSIPFVYEHSKAWHKLSQFFDDIEDAINEHICDVSKQIYKTLEDDYYYYQDDEFIEQYIKDNGIEYVVDDIGRLIKTLN